MRASRNSKELIKKYQPCYLEPTLDKDSGLLVIGYGHVDTFKKGYIITQSEAERLLRSDILECIEIIKDVVHVKLNQNQVDALVSFVFDLGSGALKSSAMLKLINQNNFSGAAKEFTRWVFAGNRRVPNMVLRRQDEQELFIKPVVTVQSVGEI